MTRAEIVMLRGWELAVERFMGCPDFLFSFWQALRAEALNRDQLPFFK